MKKLLALTLAALTLLCAAGCGAPETKLDPADPVTLTMWHVYGEQADSPMNRMVAEFNETVGLEQGIVVDVTVVSNGSEIGGRLLDAQAGKPGEEDLPDLFFCHTGNAAALGTENLLDWNTVFSDEEREEYVKAFLDEGVVEDRLVVFPVSKSTHLLFLNGTEFARFSRETGVTYEDLATWPGFFEAAERYHSWSGGKTFCALDFPLRALELSILSQGGEVPMKDGWYDVESPELQAAWLPFGRAIAQGHVALSDLFANTQIMTGETAAGLGSSAAILYYNDVVTYPDNTTEPMDLHILPMPQAQGGQAVVTQAGVGLCALAGDEKKTEAASVFAHWLTEPERNLDFVASTGYMPVHKGAFEGIGDYPFAAESYQRLYETLRTVEETSVSVTEPAWEGYYGRVSRFYDQLRALQPQLRQRSQAGEDPDALAGETWDLLSSIQ